MVMVIVFLASIIGLAGGRRQVVALVAMTSSILTDVVLDGGAGVITSSEVLVFPARSVGVE